MKKYIVCLPSEDIWNASSKARDDIEAIAVKNGFNRLVFSGEKTSDGSITDMMRLVRNTFSNWNSIIDEVESESMVLVQYPHYPMKTSLILRHLLPRIRQKKNVRFVALVHDLNSVRGSFGWAGKHSDNHLLKQFDTIICHNDEMKNFLIDKGFDEKRLVSLKIFDYLTEKPILERSLPDGIALAGNLSPEKCGYITEMLGVLDGKIAVNLYGNGFVSNDSYKTVIHHGAFPPADLPGVLEGAFGLVWDGTTIDSCSGIYGEYLRINNPHKVSLYLASGMPVIIWKKAALASFIVDNRLGVTVKSISDIPKTLDLLSEEDYNIMKNNAKKVAELLRNGHYFDTAINS